MLKYTRNNRMKILRKYNQLHLLWLFRKTKQKINPQGITFSKIILQFISLGWWINFLSAKLLWSELLCFLFSCLDISLAFSLTLKFRCNFVVKFLSKKSSLIQSFFNYNNFLWSYIIIDITHYSNSHYLAVFFISTLRWSYRSRSIVCITYRFKHFSTLGLITKLPKTRITKRVIRRNFLIQPWLRWSMPTQMYLYLAAKLTLQVCTRQTTKTILPYYLQCNCIYFQSPEYSPYLTFTGPTPS